MELRERAPSTRPVVERNQADVSLNLLGGFELRLDDRAAVLPMMAKRLLVFLALRYRPLGRIHVSQSLWLEATEQHADGNLRTALWKINRLSGSLIDMTGGQLALGPRVTVDLHRSLALAEKLTDEGSLDELELDERMLCEELLPDWYDDWVLAEREQYRQLRLHGLECLCQRLTLLGSFGHAVRAGLTAVAGEPLRESANLVLIRAYLAEGNAGEAVRHYRSFRGLLRSELGVSPTDAMNQLILGLAMR